MKNNLTSVMRFSALAAILLAATCLSVSAHEKQKDVKPYILSEQEQVELRQRAAEVRGLLSDYSGEYFRIIAGVAITIESLKTHDPLLARRALHWATATIPYVQTRQFEPNPFIAMVDLMSLTQRVEDFLTVGKGQEYFGNLTEEARSGAVKTNTLAWEYARMAFTSEEFTEIQEIVSKSVKVSPLEFLFSFSDVKGLSAARMKSLKHIKDGGFLFSTLTENIGDTAAQLENLDRQFQRLNTMVEGLPMLGRLQTEIFVYDWLYNKEIKQAVNNLGTLIERLSRASSLLDALPHEKDMSETVKELQNIPVILSQLNSALDQLPPQTIEQLIKNAETSTLGLQKLGILSDKLISLINFIKPWTAVIVMVFATIVLIILFLLARITFLLGRSR